MKKKPCRVCLDTKSESIDFLMSPLPCCPGEKITILEMFAIVTEIALQVGDNSILCIKCQKRLLEAYKFKSEAQNAIQLLEKVAVEQIETKVEVEELEYDELANVVMEDPKNIIQPLKNINETSLKSITICTLSKAHCRYCLQYYKGRMKEHEVEHILQNGGLECNYCGKKFRNRKLILEHLVGVHLTDKRDPNRPRHTCEICGCSYSEKSSLRNHKRDKHSDNPRIKEKKVCPYCGESKIDLPKHIEIKHTDKKIKFTCELCKKHYTCKESLRSHQRIMHEQLGKRTFECPECDKLFKTQGELRSHVNGVHGEDLQLPCVTCGKLFKSHITLKFHMRMHNASSDFSCDICGAAFKTNSYLQKHKRCHSDEKNYICKYCQMAFKHSGVLSKHMKLHTKQFVYCDLCPTESFIDSYSLRLHNEKVHLGITYRCDTCGKEYGTKKHLKQHQNAQQHDLTKWTKVIPNNVNLS